MTKSQRLKLKRESLRKMEAFKYFIKHRGYSGKWPDAPLDFDDCGYCKIHSVSIRNTDGCVNCALNNYSLCATGQGTGYQSVRRYLRVAGSDSRDALSAATRMVKAICKDIKTEEAEK